jgi:hypothetical protein
MLDYLSRPDALLMSGTRYVTFNKASDKERHSAKPIREMVLLKINCQSSAVGGSRTSLKLSSLSLSATTMIRTTTFRTGPQKQNRMSLKPDREFET